tara:strand:- start:89896 stop:90912 length:1017 start_codon:yes stop_codon:yes gene_type:complete
MKITSKIASTILLFTTVFFKSCEKKREALGADNEIRVLCSDLDKDKIKKSLSYIFNDTIYTPQAEPYYYLKFTEPETYKDLMRQNNLIIAAINQDDGNSGLQLIKKLLPEKQILGNGSNDLIFFGRDINAFNQTLMIINAHSEDELRASIKEKTDWIRKQYQDQFLLRQERFLFKDNRNDKIEKEIKDDHGIDIKIPWGWEIILNSSDSNFVWIGREYPFQWISISWTKGLLAEDEVSVGSYMWEWPKKYYGTIKFNDYKFHTRKKKFKNHIAWRAEGVWETVNKDEAKGGPFRSYLFYNEINNLTYHLNMIVFNPGKDKSIYIRQMDMILKTLKVSK